MDLADWMSANGKDDAAVGMIVGKSRTRVSRYRRKLEPIPGEVVKQLVEFSGGAMTADELLGIKQPEAAQ